MRIHRKINLASIRQPRLEGLSFKGPAGEADPCASDLLALLIRLEYGADSESRQEAEAIFWKVVTTFFCLRRWPEALYLLAHCTFAQWK